MNPAADTALYKRDFLLWARHNAQALRRGCYGEADIEHIAEELEGLASRDERAVKNRLTVLVMHLLKWRQQPERRYSRSGKSSWLSTIVEQRRRLAQLLENSPSLKPFAREALAEIYPYALERAVAETGIPMKEFPDECPFRFERVLDRKFLPE
jgi:hypothetical protein